MNYFIYASELVNDPDYEVLTKKKSTESETQLAFMNIQKFIKLSKLILFYKEALVEFLVYRDKLNNLEIKQILDYDSIRTESDINNSLIKKFNGEEIYILIGNIKHC